MTDFEVALRGTLASSIPGEEVVATNAEAQQGQRNDVIATPASISAYWSATAFPTVAPIEQAVPVGGTTNQVLSKNSNADFDVEWVNAGAGDMLVSIYDPQGISADAFDRANHTGTQSVSTITGLGTAATTNATDYATAAQGANADSAVQPTATQTLTNKRITPRSTSTASTATLTPNADNYDIVSVTAQAAPITIAAPLGSHNDGQVLKIRLRDNGTSRAITWNGVYSGYTSDLPASTVVNATMAYEFWWNAATSRWDLVAGNPIPGKWS